MDINTYFSYVQSIIIQITIMYSIYLLLSKTCIRRKEIKRQISEKLKLSEVRRERH